MIVVADDSFVKSFENSRKNFWDSIKEGVFLQQFRLFESFSVFCV
jgi:hypothetical protein